MLVDRWQRESMEKQRSSADSVEELAESSGNTDFIIAGSV